MFKNVEKNKIMLEGAYRKVKNYYYYNKNFIIMREKIADFESDEKKMDETFDIMAYHLSHESSKKSVDYFNMLIRQIDFFVLPKKFESVSSSKKSFISNTVPKNKKMRIILSPYIGETKFTTMTLHHFSFQEKCYNFLDIIQ